MDIALTSLEGLPEKAYISLRVGETRRQAHWKKHDKFHFPSGSARSVHIDVFEKLGTAQVSLAGIRAWDGHQNASVSIAKADGTEMKLDLSMEVPEAAGALKDAKPGRQEAAKQAMDYMERSGVQSILSQMVHELMVKQPEDPLAFLSELIAAKQSEGKDKVAAPGDAMVVLSAGAMRGDGQQPQRQHDVPAAAPKMQELPDLSGHFSLLAEVLKRDPSLYAGLCGKSTSMGVSLAQVIKPGIENKGHRMIKTAGLVAGDAECYDTFAPLFNAVISLRYGEVPLTAQQPHSLDFGRVDAEPIDPAGEHVVSVQVRLSRNLNSVRFPSTCSQDERRQVERLVVSALNELTGELQGTYRPLAGSDSFPPRPGGMTAAEEATLEARRALFWEPDSTIAISSGVGRDWPDARGVFASSDGSFWAWLNEEDHLRLFSAQEGPDLRGAFAHLCLAESSIAQALQQQGHQWARSERLGYLATGPANIGSGMCATVFVKLPNLGSQPDFRSTCRRLHLHAHQSEAGVWAVSNSERLGSSAADQVSAVAAGCRELVSLERKLAEGVVLGDPPVASPSMAKAAADEAAPAKAAPRQQLPPQREVIAVDISDVPGLGAEEYPGFPVEPCPEDQPDLSKHCNMMAEVLRRDPDMYGRLRLRKTKMGVTFAKVIKPGVDVKGHAMIKSVGAVAGDEESYEAFAEFFSELCCFPDGNTQPRAGLSAETLSLPPVDPTGAFVSSVRIDASRNLQGFRLLPACSLEERRKVERLCAQVLMEADIAAQGEYYPLEQSASFSQKPQGMTPEDAAMLAEADAIFSAPTSAVQLASGIGRHWPDARGVFLHRSKELAALVNDEDHLLLSLRHPGPDLAAAFARFCGAHAALQGPLEQQGHGFMRSEKFGFLTTCPSSLGAAMQISVKMRLPLLGARPDFKRICKALQLDARGGDGGSPGRWPGQREIRRDTCQEWELSQRSVLGMSEVHLLASVAEGCRHLIAMELEQQTLLGMSGGRGVVLPGLGPSPLPGFPLQDCPETLPDLSGHRSLAARVLQRDPQIYIALRSRRTAGGVPFSLAIKAAVDVVGCGTPIGLVAGDADCYETFAEAFIPALEAFLGGPLGAQPWALDPCGLRAGPIDPSGKRVLSVRLRLARNLNGLCFPPACSADERREVERLLVHAMSEFNGILNGEYFPLAGSTSHSAKPTGMAQEDARRLQAKGVLFQEPKTTTKLAMGLGRNWPDARGVFLSDDGGLGAWVNEEEHLQLICSESGDSVRAAFERLYGAERSLALALQQAGHGFAHSDRLGALTALPERLGTGLSVHVRLSLPKLSADAPRLAQLCTAGGLQVAARAPGGVVEVTNKVALGVSEVDLVNGAWNACARLVEAEEL